MCGIAGIIAKDSRRYEGTLSRMVEVLNHRGPDGSGFFFFNNCALGHRRLNVIDLVTGDQPMMTADKKFAVSFNGEIYGYKEIRSRTTGYKFQTSSDTEVILALYQKFGRKFVDHLPGMFSLALWNEEKQELICARDRFGEKPFYYAFGEGGELLFASEIKAILASGLVKPILDPKALRHYLKYLYVHPSGTIYKNIYCLPPAHVLFYRQRKLEVKRYWSLILPTQKICLTDAAEEFRRLFTQAVANQLVADVPVGVLLSGGMDSSSVVAVASEFQSNLKTFSFGFEGNRNELPYARKIAKLYKTDHHETFERNVNIEQLVTDIAALSDEPFADSSSIPTYLISKLTRKYVKVALTGDGGDELLGGYSSWYRPLFYMREYKSLFWPRLILLQVARLGYAVGGVSFPQDWQFYLDGLKFNLQYSTIGQAHNQQMARFTDNELDDLGLPSLARTKMEEINTLDRILQEDTQNYMAGDILVKIDRASMAWGLELRAPFLDVDLATFCLSLPFNLKIDDKSDKIILREALREKLPEEICNRHKRGFGAPIESWLQKPSMIALKDRFLNDPKQNIFSVLPFNKVRSLIQRSDFHNWAFLNLSIWMSTHSYEAPPF